VRNPGRRDGDDARAGSIDPPVPQAGSDSGPPDDDLVGMRASDAPRTTEPHTAGHASPTGNDDVGSDLDGELIDDLDFDVDFDLDSGPADMDDDLLFDPLLSDEPIDLAAVRADDALIDALSGGDLAGADDLADDDPLIAMLAAWAASARPEPAAATHPTDPDVAAAGPSPHLRPVTAAPTDETVGVEAASGGHPDVPTPNTASPGGEASKDGAPDTGSAEQDETDGLTERCPDLDPPTVRLTSPRRPTAEHRPATPGTVRPSLAARLPAGHGALGKPGDGPGGAPGVAATAAASVVTLLSRVRTASRRTRPPGQALPPGHPLRRAAVAVVVAALGVSGAAASGGTAQPGDPAWAITKVFFAERAESIMAAQVVSAGLERAQLLLSQRQPELAKQELAAIAASLPSVREEEGHTRLVDQQRMLEAVAALTPPLPGDPNLTSTTTPSRKTDPDPSVLAQGAPRTSGKDAAAPPAAAPPAAAPPVVAKPADPATGSTRTGTTGSSTTGSSGTGTTGSSTTGTSSGTSSGTTGSGTTGSGTTGSGTTGTGTTGSQTGTGSTAVGPTRTGLAGNDTALAESAAGAQPVVPAPAPSLDAARSAGTPETTTTDGTTTSESLPSTTDPETGSPAPATPPTADEPAPVTVQGAPEQAPVDGPAPVDNQADGNGNPSAGAVDAPKALAAGSAPAVPADAAAPAETGGAVVPDPVRTVVVETGVVPEPVNVATPTTTAETTTQTTTQTTTTASDKPARDAAADGASAADTPTHATAAGDTPEPVHVTADDNRGPSSSHSGPGSDSNSGSNSGSSGGSDSGGGSNNDNSGSDNSGSDNSASDNSGSDNSGSDNSASANSGSDNSGSDNSGSDNSGSDNSGSDDNSSDTGGPGGARASAAVSIHP
jgi:hypothetical protein